MLTNKTIIRDRPCHINLAKVSACVAMLATTMMSHVAFADVTLGGTTMHGYTPSEMIGGDATASAEKLAQLPSKIQQLMIIFIRYMLPFLAIGAVGIIIYNTIANFFRAEPGDNSDPTKKKKVPMKKVLKDIIQGFFFVLFAWIIVELIIYLLLGTEVFFEEYLLS